MSTIVTRAGKGTTLTWAEADANFTNLNTDKAEKAVANTFTAVQTITVASPSPLAINSTQAAVNAGIRLDTNKADSSVAWTLSNSQAGVNKQTSAVLRNADGGYDVYIGQTSGAQSISGTLALTVTPALVGTVSPAISVGYGTGAGGTVTQATSKSTAVTLNKPTGQIIMNNASLGANTTERFLVNNSLMAVTDCVVVTIRDGVTAGAYQVWVDGTAAGSFTLAVRNITAGALTDAVNLSFAIIKGVTA